MGGGLGELAVELAQRLVSRPWPEAERIVEVEQLPGPLTDEAGVVECLLGSVCVLLEAAEVVRDREAEDIPDVHERCVVAGSLGQRQCRARKRLHLVEPELGRELRSVVSGDCAGERLARSIVRRMLPRADGRPAPAPACPSA